MTSLTEIRKIEASVFPLLEQLKHDICDEIRRTPVPGVTKLNDLCFTVPLSVVRDKALSPEYYSSDSQARLVDRALSSAKSATSFHQKIEGMLENKNIKFGGNTYPLNDVTLEILARADN